MTKIKYCAFDKDRKCNEYCMAHKAGSIIVEWEEVFKCPMCGKQYQLCDIYLYEGEYTLVLAGSQKAIDYATDPHCKLVVEKYWGCIDCKQWENEGVKPITKFQKRYGDWCARIGKDNFIIVEEI